MIKHLYDEIAKRWYRGGSVWIYSDPHFGDEEMKTLRTNYISDDEQVKRINSKVGKNDTIVFLGDIGDISYIKKIRGYKVLIMGNHDKGASNYKRTYYSDHVDVKIITNGIQLGPDKFEDSREYNLVVDSEDNHLFDEVYEGPLMINDRLILSHEPIMGYGNYLYNIHGHMHNKEYKGDAHHMNCCAEAIDYTPVNLGNIIKKGILKDIESIHRVTIDLATKRKSKRNLQNNK